MKTMCALLILLVAGGTALADEAPREKPDDAAMRELVRQLDSDRYEERRDAYEKLCEIGLEAIPALVDARHHPSMEVRYRASQILLYFSRVPKFKFIIITKTGRYKELKKDWQATMAWLIDNSPLPESVAKKYGYAREKDIPEKARKESLQELSKIFQSKDADIPHRPAEKVIEDIQLSTAALVKHAALSSRVVAAKCKEKVRVLMKVARRFDETLEGKLLFARAKGEVNFSTFENMIVFLHLSNPDYDRIQFLDCDRLKFWEAYNRDDRELAFLILKDLCAFPSTAGTENVPVPKTKDEALQQALDGRLVKGMAKRLHKAIYNCGKNGGHFAHRGGIREDLDVASDRSPSPPEALLHQAEIYKALLMLNKMIREGQRFCDFRDGSGPRQFDVKRLGKISDNNSRGTEWCRRNGETGNLLLEAYKKMDKDEQAIFRVGLTTIAAGDTGSFKGKTREISAAHKAKIMEALFREVNAYQKLLPHPSDLEKVPEPEPGPDTGPGPGPGGIRCDAVLPSPLSCPR
ncbi:MAG: hypothetical protein ABIH04_07495 [Planctomycetota bacterium]